MGPNISPYLVPFAVDQEPRLVHQAILAVPEMLRPHLGRVVLCGGLARLPNLPRRLRRPRAQGPKIEVFVGRLAENNKFFPQHMAQPTSRRNLSSLAFGRFSGAQGRVAAAAAQPLACRDPPGGSPGAFGLARRDVYETRYPIEGVVPYSQTNT